MEEMKRYFRNNWHTSNKTYTAAGYVPFSSMSTELKTPDGEPFFEILEPGCWRGLKDGDVRVYLEHDPNRKVAKHVSLWTDDDGLIFKFYLPGNEFGKRVLAQLEADELKVSPGFKVWKDSWTQENGTAIRRIKSAGLMELSLVKYAAYPKTSACSLEEQRSIERLEQKLVRFQSGFLTVEDEGVKTDYSLFKEGKNDG